MIGSLRDKWLHDFFVHDALGRKIPADIADRLFRRLQMLDDAICDADLRSPPGNHFEKLVGNLIGWHSIRVNGQWRLIFKWNAAAGQADEVYLDNHGYR